MNHSIDKPTYKGYRKLDGLPLPSTNATFAGTQKKVNALTLTLTLTLRSRRVLIQNSEQYSHPLSRPRPAPFSSLGARSFNKSRPHRPQTSVGETCSTSRNAQSRIEICTVLWLDRMRHLPQVSLTLLEILKRGLSCRLVLRRHLHYWFLLREPWVWGVGLV